MTRDPAQKILPSHPLTRRIGLGLIGAIGVAFVAATLLGWIRPGLDASGVIDCVRLSTHAEQARCLQVRASAARPANTRAALRALTELVRAGALDDCHPLAHDLGHARLEARGNFIASMREGDASCLQGYYHGVVEAAVHQAASRGELDVATLCTDLLEEDPAYDACLHGLGHGLMRLFEDAPRAQQACAPLRDGDALRRCADGVFMENAMRYLPLDNARYRASAPHACDGLSPASAEFNLCHAEIGEIAMFYYRHDLPAALEICRAIGSRLGNGACERGARDELKTWHREHRAS